MGSKSNFHLNCPKNFVYSGDVNIEYGGTFYSLSGLREMMSSKEGGRLNSSCFVSYLYVRGNDDCDNQYEFEEGSFFIHSGTELPLKADIEQEFGWKKGHLDDCDPDNLAMLTLQYLADITYRAVREPDSVWRVQIGAKPDPLANHPWEIERDDWPNEILRGNAKIHCEVLRTLKGMD